MDSTHRDYSNETLWSALRHQGSVTHTHTHTHEHTHPHPHTHTHTPANCSTAHVAAHHLAGCVGAAVHCRAFPLLVVTCPAAVAAHSGDQTAVTSRSPSLG